MHNVHTIPQLNIEVLNSENDPQYQSPSCGNWAYLLEVIFFKAISVMTRIPEGWGVRIYAQLFRYITVLITERESMVGMAMRGGKGF